MKTVMEEEIVNRCVLCGIPEEDVRLMLKIEVDYMEELGLILKSPPKSKEGEN